MSQPIFRLKDVQLSLPYPNVYLPQFQLTNSFIWDSAGQMTLTNLSGPGGNIYARPDIMINSTVMMGTSHASPLPGANPLTNNAWLIEEAGSGIFMSDLRGTGALTDINSNTVISSGQGATSETIGLVNQSHLFLGLEPGLQFLSPVYIDSTSSITFDGPNAANWGQYLLGHVNGSAGNPPDLPFGNSIHVASLTPGYAPVMEFQFSGADQHISGATIVDKPTMMPTPAHA